MKQTTVLGWCIVFLAMIVLGLSLYSRLCTDRDAHVDVVDENDQKAAVVALEQLNVKVIQDVNRPGHPVVELDLWAASTIWFFDDSRTLSRL